MSIHIALFKWKKTTNKKKVQQLLDDIASLRGKLPGISKIITSENNSPRSQGFTHVVLIIGENQQAIDNYRKHPDHQRIAKEVELLTKDGVGVDFQD